MKKVLVTLTLLMLVLGCVFATHSVKASITPYSFQGTSTSAKGVSGMHNKYALGGGLGYEYEIKDSWFAGLEVKCITNWIEERKNLTDLSILPRGGYKYALNEDIVLYGALEAGLNLQMFEGYKSWVIGFGPVVGAKYVINDNFKAFAELENLYQFSKKDETKYTNYKISINLGVQYDF